MSAGLEAIERWFASQDYAPFPFQRQTWDAYLAGADGLIQSPTGSGKTLAAALGVMIEAIDEGAAPAKKQGRKKLHEGLRLVWITPLRALASDTVSAITEAVKGLGLDWSVELRTSDTSAHTRKKQKERLPSVLVTTPESLSLLLSYPDAARRFESLRCMVVDEWHELMGNKRGVQAELGMARLRHLAPQLRVWGISATIANPDEAMKTLIGSDAARLERAVLIQAPDVKPIRLESVLPETLHRFPWAGHLGTQMVEEVAERITAAGSSLVFTNTRSQTELWFKALLEARPQWIGQIAVHHGSLDRKLRARVEQLLHDGKLKAVVCTSSLDLGVDFWPVDQVIQIGSPKSIARAMQRAGRSGHRPGVTSRILCVPTHAFELVEFSAARWGIEHRAIEPREPVTMALDLLAQHIVTIAAGDGFDEAELLAEARSTHAYADLTDEQWRWVMDFAERGGPSLVAYPRFARIRRDETIPGRWVIASPMLGKMHRMGIGTIASDGSVAVQYMKGKRLGTIEENFIGRLRPGDTFIFAGRLLEFVRTFEMTAIVKAARSKKGAVPRWYGGRLPLSASLADAVRLRLDQAASGVLADDEMRHVRRILQLQARWSRIPRQRQVLIETLKTRDGHHNYLFPFQGRLVHEGLAALMTYRLSRRGLPAITATFNDYGIELLSPVPLDLQESDWRQILSSEHLVEDVLACVNTGELARRHFREIARIAGLLVPTRPGAPRSMRQLQASSELFYDVFREFDPANLLLDQARREVLERQLEFSRLKSALERLGTQSLLFSRPQRTSPLAFPLFAERIGSQQLRFESATDRIERMARQLELAAEQGDADDTMEPAVVVTDERG
jgi:ATP-dependent Lhr-like helicase